MRVLAALLLISLVACDDDGSSGDGATAGDGAPAGDLRLSESGVPIPPDGSTAPGTAKVGEPCTRDEDCAEPPSAKCFTTLGGGLAPTVTFPGGYCSRGCGNEDSGTPDCGEEGSCAQLSGSGGGGGGFSMHYCARVCKKNGDCRTAEGYTCRFIFPGFPGFCAPP